MPEMISLRRFVLATTLGHRIKFEPNVPSWVPDEVVPDAMKAGCVMANGEAPFFDETAPQRVEFTGDLRKSLIHLALKDIVRENNAKKFDAAGHPKPKEVGKILGFEVFDAECLDCFHILMAARTNREEVPLHADTAKVFSIISAETKDDLLAHTSKEDKVEGMTTKDLRKYLLQRHSGLARS